MRYSGLQRCEYVNGNDIGVSLYIQGCSIHCKGCFNPETWDFNGGKKFNDVVYGELCELLDKPYITRLSILGGEPLEHCNWFDLMNLLQSVKKDYPDLVIWLYTGYEYDFLQDILRKWQDNWSDFDDGVYLKEILNQVDILVAGPFVRELKDRTLAFRGSRNQQIIRLK